MATEMLFIILSISALVFVTCWPLEVFIPELTGDEAWMLCREQNKTLVRMTERTQIALIYVLRNDKLLENHTTMDFAFWTGHRQAINLQKTLTDFGQIQYEPFPDNELDMNDFFCVYALFNFNMVTFGWTIDYCYDANRSFVCESHQDLKDPPLNVTLYDNSFEREQNEAASFCDLLGQSLLKIDNETIFRGIEYYLTMEPWNQTSVVKFWTGHKLLVYQSTVMYNPFWEDGEAEYWNTDYGYCVYAVFDRSVNMLGWRTGEDCSEPLPFMCQKPLDDCFYVAQNNTDAMGEVIGEMEGTILTCERECKIMKYNKKICGGFTFHSGLGICVFLLREEELGVSVRGMQGTSFHQLICSIRPLIAKGQYMNTTTKDYPQYFNEQKATVGNLSTSNTDISTTTIVQHSTGPEYVTDEMLSADFSGKQDSLTDSEQCSCSCDTSNKTIEERIQELVKELKVDKKNTTMYLRKFYSVPDSRPLSKGMGFAAGAILVGGCVGIILMDSHRIVANVHIFWKGLRKFLHY